MPRSRWTVMLVPHDNKRVRTFQMTTPGVRVAAALIAVAMILLSGFSIGFFVKQAQHLHAERLQQENRLLASEIDRLQGEVGTLASTLDDLTAKDEKYRVMAGLAEIDSDVRAVGIGGPGTEMLEESRLYALNPTVGERVFAASYDLSTMVRRASLLDSSMEEALAAMENNTERLRATPTLAPADGHLASLFSPNRRHPVLRIRRPHNGIDIAAPVGEPIHAPAAGRVVFAGTKSGGYGNTVEIEHGHGIMTRYAHASRILVRRGETVERGQKIAEVGATGLVTGPHLHYEVEIDGQPVDPLNFIIWDADVEE